MIVKEVTNSIQPINTEKKYQFYKEKTQKDPVTGEDITMNVADGMAMTKSYIEGQIALLTEKLNLINALQN